MNKLEMKIEKEKELFALMINNPENSTEIFGKISFDMVSNEHRELFESISQLNPIDQAGIVWELKKRDYPNLSGLLQIAYSLVENTSQRIKEYYDICDSIRTDTFLTESLKVSRSNLMGLQTLSELKENIDLELTKYKRFERVKTFDECYNEIIERIEKKFHKNDSIKTNSFPSFNTSTGGLNEGNLIGIAGAFKNGKTTFGLNLILDIAGQGIPSVVFSLEMSKSEIQEKVLGYKTGISYEKLRNPQRLEESERLLLARYNKTTKERKEKLFLFDRIFTISEIESNVKALSKTDNIKAVMIDYLGLIKPTYKSKSNESREREISQLSNSLKILAKETGTIIFVLTQLNRSGIKEASSINLAESIALARE